MRFRVLSLRRTALLSFDRLSAGWFGSVEGQHQVGAWRAREEGQVTLRTHLRSADPAFGVQPHFDPLAQPGRVTDVDSNGRGVAGRVEQNRPVSNSDPPPPR